MLKLSQMTGVAVYGPKGSHGKAANTFTRVAYLQQPNTENGGGVEYGVAVRFVYENELS